MERTALDGGQFCQVIGPLAPTGPTEEWCPDFVRRWAFVTKSSPGDSSSRIVLMKEPV